MASLHTKVKNALDESRILVLGAQVLLGFQYRSFFEPGFEHLGRGERALEMVGLFSLLATVGALFLPAARHRIVERGFDTSRFHRFTMLVMRGVLLPFALGLSVDLAVAGNRIAGAWAGAICGALTAAAALAFWYGHFARRSRREHQELEDEMEDTPLDLHTFASRMVLLALALLGPGFCGDLYVVLRRAGHHRAALPIAAAMLVVFYGAWFGAMLLLRRRSPPALRRREA